MDHNDLLYEVATEVTKQLVDKGLLIEAGFESFKSLAIPPDASVAQISDMRIAFFTGAQHLFASINMVMDADANEATEADVDRVEKIHNELESFLEEMKLRLVKTEGSA